MENLSKNTARFLQLMEECIEKGLLVLLDNKGNVEAKETLNLLQTTTALRAMHQVQDIRERPESQVVTTEAGEA